MAASELTIERIASRNRYAILYRLRDAKNPDTRERRLEAVVRMLEAGGRIHARVTWRAGNTRGDPCRG